MSLLIAEHVTARPAPALRPLVATYTGYRLEGFAAGIHRGLPSPHLTVVLTIGQPLTVASAGSPTVCAYDALVGGLHATPALIHHDGNQYGVLLALEPLGCRALLGLPASALVGHDVGLDEIVGGAAGELLDRLRAATGWAERFAAVDRALLAVAGRMGDERAAVPAEVGWAWRRIRAGGGNVGVAELAAEVGWSRRHLGERFRAETGLPPKLFARVVRFQSVTRALRGPAPPGLADLAAQLGYFDQAHLTRDFTEMAGCPPTRWLAEEELPSVQDEPAVAGAA